MARSDTRSRFAIEREHGKRSRWLLGMIRTIPTILLKKQKAKNLQEKMSESFTVERLDSVEAVRSGKTRLHVDFLPHMAPSLKSHRVFS